MESGGFHGLPLNAKYAVYFSPSTPVPLNAKYAVYFV